MFHWENLSTVDPGVFFAYKIISMTTRARDFKFAGTPAQRLQLAMVALTQKSFSAQYNMLGYFVEVNLINPRRMRRRVTVVVFVCVCVCVSVCLSVPPLYSRTITLSLFKFSLCVCARV